MEQNVMCSRPDCEEIIDPRRVALGFNTCIYCGSPRKQFTVAVAYNKGPYQLIPAEMVKHIGR